MSILELFEVYKMCHPKPSNTIILIIIANIAALENILFLPIHDAIMKYRGSLQSIVHCSHFNQFIAFWH